MSGYVVLGIGVAWLATGIFLSTWLGRRGHDRFNWFLLGAVFGPLAIGPAVDEWRTGEQPSAEVLTRSAHPRGAHIDVLAGFDDSSESRAAVDTAIEIVGTHLGRLTLVTVIPFDAGVAVKEHAVEALDQEAERLAWLAPGTEVLQGPPAETLTARAGEGGYELLAIGTRGAGRAHVFGSIATELSRASKVPLLLVGGHGDNDSAPS